VAEVVLADLPRRISQWLQELGDGRVFLVEANRSGRQTDFGQPGAQSVLAGNERGSPGRAALLAVAVGESHALLCDAVDVGRAIAHQPVAITAEIGDADVVPPDDEDIRFFLFLLCHLILLSFFIFSHYLRCEKVFPFLLLLPHCGFDSLPLTTSIAIPKVRHSRMNLSLDFPRDGEVLDPSGIQTSRKLDPTHSTWLRVVVSIVEPRLKIFGGDALEFSSLTFDIPLAGSLLPGFGRVPPTIS